MTKLSKEKKFLNSSEGNAVFSGDFMYDTVNKKHIVVNDIAYSEDGLTFYITDKGNKIFTEQCLKFNDPSVNCSTHIDDYIDSVTRFIDKSNEDIELENYTKFFFLLHRLPAYMQIEFKQWINQYKLFCIYKNKKYRVTGCSRIGDIWLNSDLNVNEGYTHRICINEITSFSKE